MLEIQTALCYQAGECHTASHLPALLPGQETADERLRQEGEIKHTSQGTPAAGRNITQELVLQLFLLHNEGMRMAQALSSGTNPSSTDKAP